MLTRPAAAAIVPLMNILATLRDRFADAVRAVAPDADAAALSQMVKPAADAKFGDYQANMAMPLAKTLGKPPRDVAALLVEAAGLADLCETPEVAGPGFINLTVRGGVVAEGVAALPSDEHLGVPQAGEPLTVVIDFSSPNVAKPMHVGHLRSTVIGDALQRIYRALGHRVASDNHVGDWGTQFGMILYGYKNFRDEAAYAADPVGELARLYRTVNELIAYQTAKSSLDDLKQKAATAETAAVNAKTTADAESDAKVRKKLDKAAKRAGVAASAAKAAAAKAERTIAAVEADPVLGPLAAAHPDVADAARRETSLLHAGDAENNHLWNEFMPQCMAALNGVYERLGVTFDHAFGESHYNPMLAGVVEDLTEKGLATQSDGATVVFVEGNDAPLIVRKADGAFTYGTTDLATIADRVDRMDADRILYVVDERQSEHFRLLFATAEEWGKTADFRHVSFGTVLGEDGRPYKTRSGTAVGLESLLDEAVSEARKIIERNEESGGPSLSDEEKVTVSEAVGLGGIKYADLKHNRESDYRFSYDKMLAMTGNTATYMQYAYARTRGILRKAGDDFTGGPIAVSEPAERALALRLLRFPEALAGVVEDHRPNVLTDYLFDLAGAFSTFFEQCPVIKAEDADVRASRLRLVDLTGRVILRGLTLLGIETVEKM